MKLRNIGEIKRRSKKGAFPWFVFIIIFLVGYGLYWLAQNPPGIPSIRFSIPTISLPFLSGSEKQLLILYLPGLDAKLMNQWRDDLPNIQQLAEHGIWQELEPIAPVIPEFSLNALTTGLIPIPTEKNAFDDLNVLSNINPTDITMISDTISSLSVQDASHFWSVLEQNGIITLRLDAKIQEDSTDLYEQFLHETSTRTGEIIHALNTKSAPCLFAVWHSVLSFTQQNYPGTDEEHPLFDVERSPKQIEQLKNMYVQLDLTLRTIMNEINGKTVQIMLVSDQGLPTAKHQVNVNTWLWQQGFLTLNEGIHVDAVSLQPMQDFLNEVDWDQTQVFSNGMGCIFIHFVETEENSLISGVQWDALRMDVMEKLSGWKDHRWVTMNDPVVQSLIINDTVKTASVYQMGKQPDFQINFQPAYTVSPLSRSGMIESEKDMIRGIRQPTLAQTYHAQSGVLISNGKIKLSQNPTATEITPVLYQFFGLNHSLNESTE